jgi:Amt family ammonium transporter
MLSQGYSKEEFGTVTKNRLKQWQTLGVASLLLMLCMTASAQGAPAPAPAKNDTGDTAWMLVSSALVLFMTPGLALFYGGMVRAKNILNMLMKSFIAISVVTVLWVLIGYSLAFAAGGPFIGGMDWVALKGVGLEPNATYSATYPQQVHMVYQLMFAIITPALISGAVAERMKFSTYVVFIGLWSLLVYAPLAHMVWGLGDGQGFLGKLGALDFAGGTVVHISSGMSALVLAVLLGKRKHAGDARPHNLPMTLIGTGILWFGWFGFNAGSAGASGSLAASAFVVTHIAAATAGLSWVIVEWIAYKKPTALGFASGAVAGLVAITPASGYVGPIAAIIMGAVISPICFSAIKLKSKLGYDDTLDVFGVHGVGGTVGALLTGVFCQKAINSLGADAGMDQFIKQAIGAGVAIGYSIVVTLILGLILKATMGLRVSEEDEIAGLDLSEHGESAYADLAGGEAEGIAH